MRAYIVGRNEDLQSIAARLGFDPEEVWNADENAELREARDDPQVLAPGDILYVPDAEPVELGLRAQTTNEYTADVEYVDVGLNLSAGGSAPLADEPFEVHGLRQIITGTSDDEGRAEFQVPAHVRQVYVYFPEQGSSARVRLGHLNPVHDEEGVRTRLFNLGYLASEDLLGPRLATRQTPEARRRELEDAIRSFQEDEEGLTPSGELDDDTLAAIRGRHGQ